MPNAIRLLWWTCVKFTKLQNLIFFFLFHFFSSFSYCILSVAHFLPSLSPFLHLRSVPLFEFPPPPPSVLFSYFYSSRVPPEIMTTSVEAEIRFFVARCVAYMQARPYYKAASSSWVTPKGRTAWHNFTVVTWTVHLKRKLNQPTRKGVVLARVWVTTAVVFRHVTPRRSVSVFHSSETPQCLHLQGLMLDPQTFQDGGTTFLWNVGKH